jgi:3-hydroxy-3-methylglutaryl CoA synthase
MQTPSFADLLGADALLDAVALVEARMQRDGHAADAIVIATDDVDHWRNVAGALAVALGETLEAIADEQEQREYLDHIRRQALGRQ